MASRKNFPEWICLDEEIHDKLTKLIKEYLSLLENARKYITAHEIVWEKLPEKDGEPILDDSEFTLNELVNKYGGKPLKTIKRTRAVIDAETARSILITIKDIFGEVAEKAARYAITPPIPVEEIEYEYAQVRKGTTEDKAD